MLGQCGSFQNAEARFTLSEWHTEVKIEECNAIYFK
jgi:hypothetical protein